MVRPSPANGLEEGLADVDMPPGASQAEGRAGGLARQGHAAGVEMEAEALAADAPDELGTGLNRRDEVAAVSLGVGLNAEPDPARGRAIAQLSEERQGDRLDLGRDPPPNPAIRRRAEDQDLGAQ